MGDTIGAVEHAQCHGGLLLVLREIPSVLWRLFTTAKGNHNNCRGKIPKTLVVSLFRLHSSKFGLENVPILDP